jgi:hypothetical protein
MRTCDYVSWAQFLLRIFTEFYQKRVNDAEKTANGRTRPLLPLAIDCLIDAEAMYVHRHI